MLGDPHQVESSEPILPIPNTERNNDKSRKAVLKEEADILVKSFDDIMPKVIERIDAFIKSSDRLPKNDFSKEGIEFQVNINDEEFGVAIGYNGKGEAVIDESSEIDLKNWQSELTNLSVDLYGQEKTISLDTLGPISKMQLNSVTFRNNNYSDVVSLSRDDMVTDEVMLRASNSSPSEYLAEKRYLAVFHK